jgi:hypothetical protein
MYVVALAYPAIALLREERIVLALSMSAPALGFVVNITFVIVSQAALVTMSMMLSLFAALRFSPARFSRGRCAS